MRTLVRRKAVRMEAQKSRGFYLCKEQKGKAMGNLDIKEQKKKWIYLKEWNCYKLEQVCYCEKPRVQKEQSMNIFVPAEYLDGQGNVLHEEIRMGYTASTAPVIFENGLAGYHEAEPFELDDHRSMGVEAVLAGFVYVSCGCRGRSSVDEKGVFCGKAPVSVADLKAGIRFLKRNASVLPGNMERIISVGISAGGAMSTLLGCTGDCADYEEEWKEMGADLTQSDQIFGAQCYCPISDLDHADFAYEWMFEGQTHYTGMPFVAFGEGNLSPFAQSLSRKMGEKYVEYFNSLELKNPDTGELLKIAKDHGGNGSVWLKKQLEKAADKYVTKFPEKRQELEQYSWLRFKDGKTCISSINEMEQDYHKRLKLCPAFDDLDLIQAENQEFGTSGIDKRHFNTQLAGIMEDLKEEYPGETARYLPGYKKICGDKELARQKRLLNPLNYIGKEKTAPYYRIRVGAKDADTSLTVTMILALKLMECGKTNVDYEIVWNEVHGRADYPGEMVEWVRSIYAI